MYPRIVNNTIQYYMVRQLQIALKNWQLLHETKLNTNAQKKSDQHEKSNKTVKWST